MKEKGDNPSETTRLVMRGITIQEVWAGISFKGQRGKASISTVPIVARILKGVFLTYSAYNPFNINADLILGWLRINFVFFAQDKINLNPSPEHFFKTY